MVSPPQGVLGRVQEGRDPLLLVVLQVEPAQGKARQPPDGENDHGALAEAEEQDDGEEEQKKNDGGSQVRFEKDEDKGHEEDQEGNNQLEEVVPTLLRTMMEVLGERQGQGDLDQLGRLERERAEFDPAFRPGNGAAHEQDAYEQQEGTGIDRVSVVFQVAIVDQDDNEYAQQSPETPPDELFLMGWHAALRGAALHRAVKGEDAEEADRKQCGHEGDVKRGEPARLELFHGPSTFLFRNRGCGKGFVRPVRTKILFQDLPGDGHCGLSAVPPVLHQHDDDDFGDSAGA